MGRKRKYSDRYNSDGDILRKIRKLEKRLRKRRRRSSSYSSETSPESLHHDQSVNNSDIEMIIPTEHDDSMDDEIESTVRSMAVPVPIPTDSVQSTSKGPVLSISANPLPSMSAVPVPPTSAQSAPSTTTSSQAQPADNKKDGEISTIEVIPLDDDILTLLGDAPKEDCPVGKDIHSDIAKRMQDILQNGLKKEVKEKMKEDYPVPGNCQLFKAPILNLEIKAAISDILQKKDTSFAARQDQIGVALTALTKAMDILVADKSEANQTILKHVSNACRLLCDTHYIDTKMRRNFLVSTLNNKLKDTLKESKRDKNLFGETLPEKLKATKAITKSSQDLKIPKPKPSNGTKNSTPAFSNNNLNWKHPQSNNLNRRAPATSHRTAGTGSRNETPRSETASRKAPPANTSRARASAPYKNYKKT